MTATCLKRCCVLARTLAASSPGTFFLDDATTGDGMLTAVKIASIVSLAGALDSLVADLKIYPQKIVNVRVKSKPPLESLVEVSRTLGQAEKALGQSGRVILRYSGEQLARVMVEAERDEDVRRWTDSLASAVRSRHRRLAALAY